MLKETLNKLVSNRNTELAQCKDDLDKLMSRIAELEKINDESENEEELKAAGEELDALKTQKAELEAEIQGKQAELEEINKQIAELDKPADEQSQENSKRALNFMKREERTGMNKEELEQRAKAFMDNGKKSMESRSTLISGGTLATPTGVSGVNDMFNTVSSIVDLVKVVDCKGMSSNKVAYMSAMSSADSKTEGSAASSSDPTFAYVTITPASYALVSYVSDQIRKQTPLNYEEKINSAAKEALRAKAATIITTAITGSDLLEKVNGTLVTTSGTTKGKIDEKTLRKIVLAYGGDENVEGNAYLFLNKTDLVAFGDVRGTNEKKAVYDIEPDASNPNTGIIRDGGLAVKYVINSNCTAFDGTTQAASSGADKITMFYGQPTNCELDLFGDYEIKVSDDYKFAENLLTIRGQVDAGADVVKNKGFVALVLPKAAQ